MASKLLFASKKNVEPAPSESGSSAGGGGEDAPVAEKKFSALLGNRKAGSNSIGATSSTTAAASTASSSTSKELVKAVSSEEIVAKEKERSVDHDHAPLFALCAAASDAAGVERLRAALPKEGAARRTLVAAAVDKQQQKLLHVAPAPDAARFLVNECGADVAAKDRKGNTPLHVAAKAADAALCNALIDLGSPLMVQNGELSTALHYLVRASDMPREQFEPLFKKLFTALPNARLTNKNGDTILHIAALYGNIECVRELLASGLFDVNQRNAHKDAPLHYAARGGDDDVVDALLAAGADVRMKGSVGTPQQLAAKEGQEHLLPVLDKALALATKDDEDPARLNIVNELLSTEKTYVDSLVVLVEKYGAIAKEKKLLSDAEYQAVFQNADTLLSFHRMFLADLEKRIATWNRHSLLGDLFVRLHGFFKLYMQYINGFDKSTEALKQALKQKKFREAHDHVKRHDAKLLDMASILIMPVQRIPRYSLLLEDLIRKTAAEHADLPKLQEAASKMRETAGYLNQAKSGADSRARMLALDKQFTNWPAAADKLLQPARNLKFETQKLSVAAADPNDDHGDEDVQALITARDNFVFVFSDLAIVASPSYRVVGYYALASASVVRLAAGAISTADGTSPCIIINGADAPSLCIWGESTQLAKLDAALGEAVAANPSGTLPQQQVLLPTAPLLGAFVKPASFVHVSLPAPVDAAAAAAADAAPAAAAAAPAAAEATPAEATPAAAAAADDGAKDGADDGGAEGDPQNKSDTMRRRRRRKKKTDGDEDDAKDGKDSAAAAAPAAAEAAPKSAGPLTSVSTTNLVTFESSSRSVALPASVSVAALNARGASVVRVGASLVWLGGGLARGVALADDGDSWLELAEESVGDGEATASARAYAAAGSDGKAAYVFGGRAADGSLLDDLWRVAPGDGGVLALTRLHGGGVSGSSAPSARAGATATVFDGHVWVFGGAVASGELTNELWCYDIASGKWSEARSSGALKPTARHSAAVTSFATFVIVHGGAAARDVTAPVAADALSDAWAFDSTSKRWTLFERNFLARAGHAFVQLERGTGDGGDADADGALLVLGGGGAAQSVSGRSMATVFGALMTRENAPDKKKRSGKLSRMSRVITSSIAGDADKKKSGKGSVFRVGSHSQSGASGDDGSNFQIGAPSNFTNPVSVSRDFEWSDDAHKDFELTRCVGEGGFGSVWRAQHRTGGFVVAVKVIRGFRGGAETSGALSSEIKVLKQCRHQCIVAYYGACLPAPDTLWILTEFCELGSLGDMMDAIGQPLDETQAACIARDVADGLRYLHQKGIVHRDVKLDNILMNEQGFGMLTDFGLSERIVDAVSTRAGTPHHMAPEVVRKQPSSAPSDIWSFGITQIEMYDGRVPHSNLSTSDVMQTIIDSAPPKPIRPQSAHFAQFLSACLQKDPAQRKTAVELLALPFVAADSVQVGSARRRDIMSAFVQTGVSAYAHRGRNRSRSGATTASRTSKGASLSQSTNNNRRSSSIRSDDTIELVAMRSELASARDVITAQSNEIAELKALVEKQSAELARVKADFAKATAAAKETAQKSAKEASAAAKEAAAVAAAAKEAAAKDEASSNGNVVKATDPKAALPPAVVAQRTVQAGTVSSRLAIFQQNATKAIDAFVTKGGASTPPTAAATSPAAAAAAAATPATAGSGSDSGNLTPRDFGEFLKEKGGKAPVVDEESDALSE